MHNNDGRYLGRHQAGIKLDIRTQHRKFTFRPPWSASARAYNDYKKDKAEAGQNNVISAWQQKSRKEMKGNYQYPSPGAIILAQGDQRGRFIDLRSSAGPLLALCGPLSPLSHLLHLSLSDL